MSEKQKYSHFIKNTRTFLKNNERIFWEKYLYFMLILFSLEEEEDYIYNSEREVKNVNCSLKSFPTHPFNCSSPKHSPPCSNQYVNLNENYIRGYK